MTVPRTSKTTPGDHELLDLVVRTEIIALQIFQSRLKQTCIISFFPKKHQQLINNWKACPCAVLCAFMNSLFVFYLFDEQSLHARVILNNKILHLIQNILKRLDKIRNDGKKTNGKLRWTNYNASNTNSI